MLNELKEFISKEVAKVANIDASQVDVNKPFDRYGMDSAHIVALAADISDKINFEVDPVSFYENNTIEKIVMFIESKVK